MQRPSKATNETKIGAGITWILLAGTEAMQPPVWCMHGCTCPFWLGRYHYRQLENRVKRPPPMLCHRFDHEKAHYKNSIIVWYSACMHAQWEKLFANRSPIHACKLNCVYHAFSHGFIISVGVDVFYLIDYSNHTQPLWGPICYHHTTIIQSLSTVLTFLSSFCTSFSSRNHHPSTLLCFGGAPTIAPMSPRTLLFDTILAWFTLLKVLYRNNYLEGILDHLWHTLELIVFTDPSPSPFLTTGHKPIALLGVRSFE